MASPQSRATTSPSGMPGSTRPAALGAGGRAQQPQAEDGAAMRVDPRGRGQHGRLGLEPDDPQPPHPAAARAGLGQLLEIGPDGRSAGTERAGVHVVVTAAVDMADQAGLRPGFQLQEQCALGVGRDRPPIQG